MSSGPGMAGGREDGVMRPGGTLTLDSVQVGRVRSHGTRGATDPLQKPWSSAFVKQPVTGPIALGPLGIDGDEQADTNVHGGPDRALLTYASSHYPLWREELGIAEMGPGGFGENLTLGGADETTVCVGDVLALGDARVQVTQPRMPCSNIARRWKVADMVGRVTEMGRGGWYLRVLEPGTIHAGIETRVVERPYPEWPVARVFELRVHPERDRAALARLAQCPVLSKDFRAKLQRLMAQASERPA